MEFAAGALVVLLAFGAVEVARRRTTVYEEPPPTWSNSIHADKVIAELDRDLLLRLAHPERLLELRRGESEVLDVLAESLAMHGLLEPLEMVIDRAGQVTLRDGHHRLLSGEDIIDRYPVRITTSERIRGYHQPLVELLPDLLRSAAAGNDDRRVPTTDEAQAREEASDSGTPARRSSKSGWEASG